MKMNDRKFPPGFLFGAATASLQIEGNPRAAGAGETVWERACRRPGFILNDDRLDKGADHLARWKEDVALMKEIGLQAYRFSINWTRIFPDGRGRVNPRGLDFYQALIDELLANGIEPWVTFFHWETPQALEEQLGGWRSKETAYALADYAGYVCAKISDRVTHYFTLNEIGCFTHDAYNPAGEGMAPAAKCSRKEMLQATHNACLAHGLALQAARAGAVQPIRIGIAQNGSFVAPIYGTPEHLDAACKAFRHLNANTLTLLFEGRYLEEFRAEAGADMPEHDERELAIIAGETDFLGLNIYTAQYVAADAAAPSGYRLLPWTESFPKLDMPWNFFVPEALYYEPLFCHRLWKVKSIYISENGCAALDRPQKDSGQIDDIDRVHFLRSYLGAVRQAIADGVPLDGYFCWTLMDNFEWKFGYAKRFGLIYVNGTTMERTPKLSAQYYRTVIRDHSLY